jgi:uncharacterized glyoxalase superfamily protein PhnB
VSNRSAPDGPVIPVLAYADVKTATAWLVEVLGFVERVRIGPGHRAQLSFGAGSLIVADTGGQRATPIAAAVSQSVMLRVDDVIAYCERARLHGAAVVEDPSDFAYGERQCSFRDPGGHLWILTQTIRDVDPEEWGGTSVGDA